MFKNLKLIFNKNNKDIRKRLGFTLLCLFIFVVGTTIPVPGVSLKAFDFGDLDFFVYAIAYFCIGYISMLVCYFLKRIKNN